MAGMREVVLGGAVCFWVAHPERGSLLDGGPSNARANFGRRRRRCFAIAPFESTAPLGTGESGKSGVGFGLTKFCSARLG